MHIDLQQTILFNLFTNRSEFMIIKGYQPRSWKLESVTCAINLGSIFQILKLSIMDENNSIYQSVSDLATAKELKADK